MGDRRNRHIKPQIGAADSSSTALSEPHDRADSLRVKLFEGAIAAALESYRENSRITTILDDKAQKTTQTAGMFLGAGFAVMRPGADGIAKFIGDVGLWTMAAAIALFMLTVVLYLVENRIQSLPTPLNPERVYEMTMQLVRREDADLLGARYLNHLNDVCGLWIGILAKQQVANSTKARLVRLEQLSLALAMICVGLLLILVLQRARIH